MEVVRAHPGPEPGLLGPAYIGQQIARGELLVGAVITDRRHDAASCIAAADDGRLPMVIVRALMAPRTAQAADDFRRRGTCGRPGRSGSTGTFRKFASYEHQFFGSRRRPQKRQTSCRQPGARWTPGRFYVNPRQAFEDR